MYKTIKATDGEKIVKDIVVKYANGTEYQIAKGFAVEVVEEDDEYKLQFELININGADFRKMLSTMEGLGEMLD